MVNLTGLSPTDPDMIPTSQSIQNLIRQRFSCRKYEKKPIPALVRKKIQAMLGETMDGPFGNQARFRLIAAKERDSTILHGLGTYAFIQNPAGFVLGAICPAEKFLEDFGYLMETIVLQLTDLGLGTCWLGGTFTQSSFARKMDLQGKERMPAVVSVGLIADQDRARDTFLRRRISADDRKPWEKIFFQGDFGYPIETPQGLRQFTKSLNTTSKCEEIDDTPALMSLRAFFAKQSRFSLPGDGFGAENAPHNEIKEEAFRNDMEGELREESQLATALEMVRLAPSASNKQPWRVVVTENACHFYLQRTRKYGKGSFTYRVLGLADLQRVDLGIAMCHFDLTARELGLPGRWVVEEPGIQKPDDLTEYVASWILDESS